MKEMTVSEFRREEVVQWHGNHRLRYTCKNYLAGERTEQIFWAVTKYENDIKKHMQNMKINIFHKTVLVL